MTTIGPYTLFTVETGQFRLDGGAMFGVVPKALWPRRITPDDRNRILLNMRCLLVEGEGRLILIDAGIGDKYGTRFQDMFAIDHSKWTLSTSLRTLGFDVSDVTDIIVTHLHFDHCGGCSVRKSDVLLPAFPNAILHVQTEHLAAALKPNEREKASFLPRNIHPLVDSGQLNLLDGPQALFPGIDVMIANGHTTAQQIVKIGGADRTLVYAADLLPTTHHVRGPWVMSFDVRPLVTLEEKARFLKTAAEEKWRIFFEHDADTIVADIKLTEYGITAVCARPLSEAF